MPASKSQTKVACLTCRSSKIRCDGQLPCANCLSNQRECRYLPSRRGGPRRGKRYQNAKKQRANAASHSSAAEFPPFSATEANSLDKNCKNWCPNTQVDGPESSIADLVCPFNEIEGALGFIDPGQSSEMGPTACLTTNPDRGNSLMIRAYQSEADLINAYYIFIHPYLPLLPPPAVPRFADRACTVSLTNAKPDKSALPFWPESPFGLALMAILVLIPLPEDPHPMREGSVVLRRSYANMYAHAALESVETSSSERGQNITSHISNTNVGQEPPSSLHPEVSLTLMPILALLLLGVYEYCQHGNRRQMRAHVYHALTISMDLSLYTVGSRDSKYLDAQTRAWWMTMYLVYQSSIFSYSQPIMLMHDARINTPFPEFFGYRELLPALMRAQDALIKTGGIVKELTGAEITATYSSIGTRVRELDSLTLAVSAELDQIQAIQTTEKADAVAAQNLLLNARFLVHIARIKLHRLRAFGDYPVFLGDFCDLRSINSSYYVDFRPPLPPDRLADINSIFPFTEQESTSICLKAALVLSRILRNVPWPNPSYSDAPGSPEANSSRAVEDPAAISMSLLSRPQYPRSLPYLACGGMQCCYVLMILLRKVRMSLNAGDLSTCYYLLNHPEPGTETQDAERLIEELRHGTKSVYHFMASNSIFEGVVDMAREVETVYGVHFRC